MTQKKYTEQNKQRFDDATFAITSLCAKKSKTLSLLGEEKIPKL